MKTITRILKNVVIKRQAISKKEPIPRFNRPPIKRTPVMISKVKRLVDTKNPASHRHNQKETTLALSTINKIIHQDLSKDTWKKLNVYYLKINRKLYEKHLARDKSEFAVTLDEAFIYEYEKNEQTRICYVSRGEIISDDWVFEESESFSKSFMVVGIISERGTVPLFRVPARVKINAKYYINYFLKPLFSVHFPRLYPNEVFLHSDGNPVIFSGSVI